MVFLGFEIIVQRRRDMKRLSLALIAVGAFMVATVDFSPAFAGEGTTVAFSGPMCGGCIGKLTGCAKQVE